MIPPCKCIVVANGSFPEQPVLIDMIRQAETCIACDGAGWKLLDRGLEPTAIIGDMDSIPDHLQQQYHDRVHIIKEQETNDLTKAVHFAHHKGYREILIMGATGLREDHTLANIFLLAEYAPLFERVEMISDYGLLTPLLHSGKLKSDPGQQVSIFSVDYKGEITTHGLRYPIEKRRLTAGWQGSLNEALSDEFTIILSPEARVIVFRELTYES